jgi:hypothetical protein
MLEAMAIGGLFFFLFPSGRGALRLEMMMEIDRIIM